jgi:hypothetical protein
MMNVFNRIVTVLLLVALFVIIVLFAVFPAPLLRWLGEGALAWEDYLASWEGQAWYIFVAIRIGVVILAVLVFGVLMFLELRRRKATSVRVVTTEGSTATVITSSVAQRLVYHVDRLADVVSVVPSVAGRGSTVHVDLDLETSPLIDVPMKTDEVVAVAKEVVEEQMGLQLGRIQVRIKHIPYPEENE